LSSCQQRYITITITHKATSTYSYTKPKKHRTIARAGKSQRKAKQKHMMHMMCFCIQFQLHGVVGGGDRRKITCATRSTQCNTTPVSSKDFFAAPTTKRSHLTPVKKEMLLLQEHCKREQVTNYLSSSRRLFQPDCCQPRQRKKQTK
jgi:hypothetical protein